MPRTDDYIPIKPVVPTGTPVSFSLAKQPRQYGVVVDTHGIMADVQQEDGFILSREAKSLRVEEDYPDGMDRRGSRKWRR